MKNMIKFIVLTNIKYIKGSDPFNLSNYRSKLGEIKMNSHKVYKPAFHNSVSLFLFMSCLFLGIQTTSAADTQLEKSEKISPAIEGNTSKHQNGKVAIRPGVAGMKLYIDTETGEFVVPSGKVPSAKPPSVAQERMFSTSSKGLIKRSSNVPGGGESVSLQGRFMSPLILKIGPDGKQSINHGMQKTYNAEKE